MPITTTNRQSISYACLSAVQDDDSNFMQCKSGGWITDSMEKSTKYTSTPPMPIEQCNSTSQFRGYLADDSLCSQTSNATCNVSTILNTILSHSTRI